MSGRTKDPQTLCCIVTAGPTVKSALDGMKETFQKKAIIEYNDYYYSIVSIDIESFREGLFKKAFVVKAFYERFPRKRL